MKLITSVQNSQIKHLGKLLSQAKARREGGQAVLEGVHLLDACLRAGIVPEQVYLPEAKTANREIRRLAGKLPESLLTQVSDGLLAKAGSLTDGDEIMTLVKIPKPGNLPQTGDCVILDRLQDPGNVGTILRSAAAAGVRQIVLGRGCADVWSPKVLRAGMGAHFLLALHTDVDLADWRQHYRAPVWATALDSGNPQNLYEMKLTAPAAWIFGNEGSGVDAALIAAADGCVRIPMLGQTESLNAAMAATVCLFEQMRQRIQAV
ncbi:RNA methyltransferase [Neisseria chenwenguii]|uniref:RNA methyltransferase n=1 Tax=Neisseria chenwenguii TaxID=1853278 RepID=A0A220S474_9NEIS|nr:RNA methyltransferase [Neisseria chenwenguii]ASK28329.1 RNA methyltransferase [Neisseria chenwenguii]